MTTTYNRWAATIKSVADAAGGLLKFVWGTTGSLITFPAQTTVPNTGAYNHATGSAWLGGNLPHMIQQIGADQDLRYNPWAYVSTNITGQNPTIVNGFGISSVSKNESTNKISILLTTAFTSGYVAIIQIVNNSALLPAINLISPDTFEFMFRDNGNVTQDINGREVMIACIGQVA